MVPLDASLELRIPSLLRHRLDISCLRLAHGARLHLVLDDVGRLSLRRRRAELDGLPRDSPDSLRKAGYLKTVITLEHYHLMGKLMHAFVIFWAYIAFSQFFLIWYANITEETKFFLTRNTGVLEHLHDRFPRNRALLHSLHRAADPEGEEASPA